MFESLTNVSLVVQILAMIILITTLITLVIAGFSYAAYKVRKSRKPAMELEIPDFFHRYWGPQSEPAVGGNQLVSPVAGQLPADAVDTMG